jgi:hypothetical protein
MSLTIDDYLKCKKQHEEDIAVYLAKKQAQFKKQTGIEVQDIFVYMNEIETIEDSEPISVITNVSIRTKVSE